MGDDADHSVGAGIKDYIVRMGPLVTLIVPFIGSKPVDVVKVSPVSIPAVANIDIRNTVFGLLAKSHLLKVVACKPLLFNPTFLIDYIYRIIY